MGSQLGATIELGSSLSGVAFALHLARSTPIYSYTNINDTVLLLLLDASICAFALRLPRYIYISFYLFAIIQPRLSHIDVPHVNV